MPIARGSAMLLDWSRAVACPSCVTPKLSAPRCTSGNDLRQTIVIKLDCEACTFAFECAIPKRNERAACDRAAQIGCFVGSVVYCAQCAHRNAYVGCKVRRSRMNRRQDTNDDDDDECVVVREVSAEEAMARRFENAQATGRYIVLDDN